MRWRLEGDDGQGALFEDVERVAGRGELRGMELLHVRARRLINTLPRSSHLPFRHTINAYRGCSHACSYCAIGDTPVLLGDGRTRRLADLRPGDEIYGTERVGSYRRYVRTTVLDHWETGLKPAYRTTLSDGTVLVTSGEHRFLTDRGWKHVTGDTCGRGRRPHLTTNNELLGTGAFAEPPKQDAEYGRGYLCGIVRGDALLRTYPDRRRGRTGRLYRFRLALADGEALDRAQRLLTEQGVATSRSTFVTPPHRRPMEAISASSAEAFARVQELVAWPDDPSASWQAGFLAGIFDAAGSCSVGVLRIHNTDPELLSRTAAALASLDLAHVIEPARPNGCRAVRLLGGLPARLRFFHAVDPAITRKRSIEGVALKGPSHLRVVSVEPLRVDLPMYDITTGTGDFVSDGMISHNCFARPTHDYLGLDIDEGFERQIVVKTNAVARLRAELDPRRWSGEPIAMGTNTDPYQRCEGRYHLTQGLIEVLSAARNPFSILTKSTLVLRDAELLAEAAARTRVSLTFSIGTLDADVWRATERGTPAPWKRIEAIARLRELGVEAGVLVAPVLPGLSDAPEQLDAVVRAATDAGATSVGGGMVVYLEPGVREVFLGRLAESHPHLLDRYRAAYTGRVRPTREVQEAVRRHLDAAVARHRPAAAVAVRPRRPVARPAPSSPTPTTAAAEQLALGV